MNGSSTPTPTPPPTEGKPAPTSILRIAVGSSNPAKINAVLQALRRCLNRKQDHGDGVALELEGFDVESGVNRQPVGDVVTCQGAKNRAHAAYLAFKKKNGSYPHLAIGLEGGVEWVATLGGEKDMNQDDNEQKQLFCMAWMAVYGKRQASTVDLLASDDTAKYFGDKKPYYGLAKSASFPLPPELCKLVLEDGMELGEADDQLFQRKNSKQGSGSVGFLTDGIIDRAAYYEHAIILALEPWIRPELFPPHQDKPL
ncbi:hypothetical protein ACA910_003088 [Epithemia clementina (nom. ined.)]